MTYLQAIVIGLIQGVTELFPVSSLGHTVLIPALIGHSWSSLVTQEASPESPYLAFVVGLHVATATALIVYFWRTWKRLIAAFFGSIWRRKVASDDERFAWFIVIATIPVGILGLLLEHQLRVLFAKPLAAAVFLTVNGLILLFGERVHRSGRRRAARLAVSDLSPVAQPAMASTGDAPDVAAPAAEHASGGARTGGSDTPARVAWLTIWDAVVIGVVQSAALLAGISRDGVTMVAGLVRGLSREDAAEFAFLLSAPPILAAGLLKVPDLLGPLGNGIRPQILAGSVAAFTTALISVRFLLRYFRTRTLTPFAIYCLALGIACIVRFGVF